MSCTEKQFDEFLSDWSDKNDSGQVVILGSGLDSRSLRFEKQLQSVDVFELDLLSMLEYKSSVNKKINRVSKSKYVPINFGVDSLTSVFKDGGIATDKPTLVLWEGVTYFLDEATVLSILQELSSYFHLCNIVFDYAYKKYIDGDLHYYGASEIANELREIGEPHIFGIDPDSVEPFFADTAWTIQRNYTADELEKKYLNGEKIHGFHGIIELTNNKGKL